MENKIVTPVTKGFIISLVLILVSLAIYLAGESNNKAVSWIGFIPFVGGIIWTCIYYAKQMNGNVTYGNVFSHGFKATAVIIIIMLIYSILSIKILFPEIIDVSLQAARVEMEKKGTMNDDQIDKAINFTKEHMLLLTTMGVVFGYGFIGAITSAIGAAIAKKNPQTPFQSQN